MDILNTVIILIFCLLAANIVSHYIPTIPNALIQISFGIILAILFPDLLIEVDEKWFLTFFIAPLLYHDGKYFPREQLWKLRIPILSNAVILVIITTVVGGFFIHFLLPSIPLAVAFSLAAILSPTDPIAVNSIAKRVHMPANIINLARGESLINDASGLVAFKYAVAAVVTGAFSLGQSFINFAYVFFIGAACGFFLSILATMIRFLLRKMGITESVFYSLWQIMIPFAVFIITEEIFNASGVIAVLIAGLMHASVKERTETIIAEETMLTENTMSVFIFTLNGFIFLLLGLQIPVSMKETVADPNISNLFLISLVILIGLMLLLVRFLWSISMEWLKYLKSGKEQGRPSLRSVLQISFAGSRGTITMIGVLSLPLVVADGSPFPERALVIFLAAGVILFTLLLATFFLPLVCRKKVIDDPFTNLIEAKKRILQSVIKYLRQTMTEENEAATRSLIIEYKMIFRQRELELNDKSEAEQLQAQVIKIKKQALRIEQKIIFDLMDNNVIDDALCKRVITNLLSQESSLDSTSSASFWDFLSYLSQQVKFYLRHLRAHKYRKINDNLYRFSDIRADVAQKVIYELLDLLEDEQLNAAAQIVIAEYQNKIDRIKARVLERDSVDIDEQKEELRIATLEVERREIQKMYKDGDIDKNQVYELRRFVNYIENIVLFKNIH